MQLEAFNLFLSKFPEQVTVGKVVIKKDDIRLVTIGSIREHKKGDSRRVETLKARAKELGIEVRSFYDLSDSTQSRVSIVVDAPGSELKSWLSRATVGIHTMRDEHFGISVVELMACVCSAPILINVGCSARPHSPRQRRPQV